MSDDAFVRDLQAIFDANDPADGIDRHDGFGTHVRITGLRQVDDGDFRELEVSYETRIPMRWRWRFRGLATWTRRSVAGSRTRPMVNGAPTSRERDGVQGRTGVKPGQRHAQRDQAGPMVWVPASSRIS